MRPRLISVISVLIVLAVALGMAPLGMAQTLEEKKTQAPTYTVPIGRITATGQ